MIKILKYLKKEEWTYMLFGFVFILTQVYLDLKLPDYMSEITMLVQTSGNTIQEVLKAGGYMLACALGSLVSAVITGYFAAKVAANLSHRLRYELYNKVESFSLAEMNKFSTSSLIIRSTNDISKVQMLVAIGFQLLIKAPITAVWAIYKISGKEWQWTAATAGAVLVLLTIIAIIFIFAIPKSKKIQGITDKLNSVSRENLTGIRVVRAYNASEYEKDKFSEVNEELTNTNLTVNRVMSIMQPGMMLIMNGLSLAIYFIGATLINEANMQDKIHLFSDMVVFSSYAMQVIMSFMMLTMVFMRFPIAAISANRILEVLNTDISITDGDGVNIENEKVGEIEFKNVSFKYPDSQDGEYVLEDINLKINKGETVAFIGSTGSGKSTLINLIPRFYDTTTGEILVNGINVKEYKQEELNNHLGYVSQKAVLFSGDISSNIAYGRNGKNKYSEEDIIKAVEIAQGKDFVESMDDTYKASISQGGTNLSGGQKQRVSIARAICRRPDIYIFDDSFSALDYKTDKKLRSVLNKETKGATSLIVAQRIGTIKDADKIVVLDFGKIVGVGTHKELMKTCDVYQEIAYSQLSKEELNYA